MTANGGSRVPAARIADSGGLYALYDVRDKHHRRVRDAVEAEDGPIILPAPILSEVDYLLRVRLGIDAGISLLDGIIQGSYTIEMFTGEDASRCRELIRQYRGLDLGFADAAVVATVERLGVHRILTVDERDFRAIKTASGRSLTLIPADR